MSVTAVRDAIVALVEGTAGVENVHNEPKTTLDRGVSAEGRIFDGLIHFWEVSVHQFGVNQYLGCRDRNLRVRVEGFLEVARDNPPSGVRSDIKIADLGSAVFDTLSAPANLRPGSSLSAGGFQADQSIPIVTVDVDGQVHSLHKWGLTYFVQETI